MLIAFEMKNLRQRKYCNIFIFSVIDYETMFMQ